MQKQVDRDVQFQKVADPSDQDNHEHAFFILIFSSYEYIHIGLTADEYIKIRICIVYCGLLKGLGIF